ncbi:MAG: M16 family metallopeptidase [Candidatus Limnocylindrales bacterium]
MTGPLGGAANAATGADLESILARRPVPGHPRTYHFPDFERLNLPNDLQILTVQVPGRPLVTAELVARLGAADEPPEQGGATVLTARALSEGTDRYDAVALTEATERLGATLHAEASWDAFAATVEVPGERLAPSLELLAEMALHPTFPEAEVERLREERLNDLLQARADPRRRAEEVFAASVYAPASPYSRPAGGRAETVGELGPGDLRVIHEQTLDPSRAAVIVGGDLAGLDVPALVASLFGGLVGPRRMAAPGPVVADSGVDRSFVRLVHRPGSVQSEIRIGHPGVPRRVPDFHAIQVMAAILGGLFNSRLQMKLREEKGYTYGASAGFDMRRAPGPFAARAAVNTAATVPAIVDTLAELRRIRDDRVTDAELTAARDYLVGVFPLRFETPSAVVGALSGIFVHGLPDDELARYRERIESVTAAAVQTAADAHIDPERLAIVVVGDADAVAGDLEAAGLGPLEVVRDEPAEALEAEVIEAEVDEAL